MDTIWDSAPLTGAAWVVALAVLAYVCLAEPFVGRWFHRRMVAGITSGRSGRPAWYTALTVWETALLVGSLLVVAVLPQVTWADVGLRWSLEEPFVAIIALAMAAGAVAGSLGVARKGATALPEDVAVLLPRTPEERARWVGVSVGAGVAEEVLFRGLVPALLVAAIPGIPLPVVVVVQAVVFGSAHAYQGRAGVLGTGLLGLGLGVVVLLGGALWPAILLHVLVDVRWSFVRLPERSRSPRAGG